jgi:hypothetical protein
MDVSAGSDAVIEIWRAATALGAAACTGVAAGRAAGGRAAAVAAGPSRPNKGTLT